MTGRGHPSLERARRTHDYRCQCDLCLRADAVGIPRRVPWHICGGIGEDPLLKRPKCSLRRNGDFGGKGACNRAPGHDGPCRDRKGHKFVVPIERVRRAWVALREGR